MPNWCNNTVTITGPNSMIDKIEKIVNEEKDAPGLLNFMHPIPPALKDTVSGSESAKPDWQKKDSAKLIKEYGYDNWYDWCNNNWGTKWDTDAECDHVESNCFECEFETAWSPAEGIYYALREQYPDVEISWFYDEPGMQTAGYL